MRVYLQLNITRAKCAFNKATSPTPRGCSRVKVRGTNVVQIPTLSITPYFIALVLQGLIRLLLA